MSLPEAFTLQIVSIQHGQATKSSTWLLVLDRLVLRDLSQLIRVDTGSECVFCFSDFLRAWYFFNQVL